MLGDVVEAALAVGRVLVVTDDPAVVPAFVEVVPDPGEWMGAAVELRGSTQGGTSSASRGSARRSAGRVRELPRRLSSPRRPAASPIDLLQWPVRDALAVGKQRPRTTEASPGASGRETPERARLPDACGADDCHEPLARRAMTASSALVNAASSSSRPTNRTRSARPVRERRLRRSRYDARGCRSFRSARPVRGARLDGMSHEPDTSSGRGASRRACAEVSRRAATLTASLYEGVPASGIVGDDLAGSTPTRISMVVPTVAGSFSVQLPSATRISSAERVARSASSSWIEGHTEDGHDSIADELLDDATVALDDSAHRPRRSDRERGGPTRLHALDEGRRTRRRRRRRL